MNSRTGMFIFIILFWVLMIPILSMVGNYTVGLYEDLASAGTDTYSPSFPSTASEARDSLTGVAFIFNIMFFQLPEELAPPVWISLFLWMMNIFSIYVFAYFIIDIVHGGS